jgi:hypothetical protein
MKAMKRALRRFYEQMYKGDFPAAKSSLRDLTKLLGNRNFILDEVGDVGTDARDAYIYLPCWKNGEMLILKFGIGSATDRFYLKWNLDEYYAQESSQ